MANESDGHTYFDFSPRVRKSPVYAATRRWGFSAYAVYNHMAMPMYYESPEADFWREAKLIRAQPLSVHLLEPAAIIGRLSDGNNLG